MTPHERVVTAAVENTQHGQFVAAARWLLANGWQRVKPRGLDADHWVLTDGERDIYVNHAAGHFWTIPARIQCEPETVQQAIDALVAIWWLPADLSLPWREGYLRALLDVTEAAQ